MQEKDNYHRVGNQGLAAFLICNGHEMVGIRDSKDGRPQYLFDISHEDGGKQAAAFFDEHVEVVGIDFYKALSELRKQLYERKGGNKS